MSVNGFPALRVNGTGPPLVQDPSISDLPMLPADFDFNGPDSPIPVPRRTSQLDEEYEWAEEQAEKLDVVEDPSSIPTRRQFSRSPSLLKLPLAQPRLPCAVTMPLPSQLGDLKNPHRTELGSPQPLRADTLPSELVQFHELSLELADMVQTVIQTMLQISPSQVLDPSKEQFSSCSVAVPTPSLSSMFTAMRNLNYISANMASIFSQASKHESAGDVLPFLSLGGETTFDVGELLQSVGDALGGAAAQVGTELVIFHGDVGFKHVYVKGNESGLSYVLTHIVRQVLATGKHGDTVELGLYVVSGVAKLPAVDSRSSVDVLTAPEDSDGPLRCKISIAHKFATLDPLQDDSAVTSRLPPDFSTTLLERLLNKVGASFNRTIPNWTVPNQAVPLSSSEDLAWEFSFVALPSSPPAPDPASIIIHGLADRPVPSGEPTLAQLSAFAETLRAKKAILYANVKGYFAHYLTSYLTEWGMDVSHAADGVAEASPSADADSSTPSGQSSPLSFIFIDDDVDVLRSRLVTFREEQYPLNPPKRPSLSHRRVPSSNPVTRGHKVTGSISSSLVVIVHFTSLGNFKLVRELIQSTLTPFSPVPEIIVVPKPAGPRRFLTALHTVITKPIVDPSFTPIATAPSTPGVTLPVGPLITPLPSASLSGPTRPSGSRSNSERSIRSSKDISSSPLVRSTGEYFPVVRCGTTYSGGVVIHRSNGDPEGLYFNPKGSKPPTPNTASDDARSSRSSSFSKQEVGQALLGVNLSNVSQAAEQLSAFPVATSRNTLGSPVFRSPRKYSISRSLDNAPQAVTMPPDNNVVPPIKVLIVEDNDINQRFIARNLKKMKVKYDAVSDGRAAVEKWRTGEFHLILMDIQMPIMDGIEATKQIRREEKWRAMHGCLHGPTGDMTPLAQTPTETPATTPYPSSVIIVALTAGSMERDRVVALAAGCNDFLVKPVTTVWLNNKVIEWGSIKALQRWAEPDFRSSQAEQARSVAERLVVPEHRRTPSPGQSSSRKATSTAPHPPPPPSQPISDLPTSAALRSSMTSSTVSASCAGEPSPTTLHRYFGAEAPISGASSSPLPSSHQPPNGSDSNTVNDSPLGDGSVNGGDSDGIHGNGSLGTSHSAKSDPPVKEEQNAGVPRPSSR